MVWLGALAKGGTSGTEFIALAVTPLLLVSMISFPIVFVSAIIFLFKYKPRGKKLVLPVLAIVVSIAVGGYLVFGFVSLRNHIHELSTRGEKAGSISSSEAAEKIQNCEVESLIVRHNGGDYPALLNIKNQDTNMYVSKADLLGVQQAIDVSKQKCGNVPTLYENDNGDVSIISSISFDEAKSLLLSCKLQYVAMPMDQKYITKTEQKALNATGIYEAEDFAGTPISIGINESTRSKIIPIARQAVSQCPGMQFMLSPGHWSRSV